MPIHVVCDACGKDYNLKDEYAGRKVKCPACTNVLAVPAPEALAPEREEWGEDLHPAFCRDKFLLRQKLLSVSEKYEVWDEEGQAILYIERPAHLGAGLLAIFLGVVVLIVGGIATTAVSTGLAKQSPELAVVAAVVLGLLTVVGLIAVILALYPKRHITFYADKGKAEPLLEVLQDRKFMPINATYTCVDPEGNCLGRFRKNHLYNFFRRRWYIYRPDGELLAVAKEDSIILSLLRRVLGDYLFGLLRTNFIILKPDQETLIGEFNRKFTLLDRYVLDMSEDHEGYLDRRLAIALGVLLDTGERR